MLRSPFAKYLITQVGISASCREILVCAGKALSRERVNPRRKHRLSSSPPSSAPSLSLLSLDHSVRAVGVGHGVWFV